MTQRMAGLSLALVIGSLASGPVSAQEAGAPRTSGAEGKAEKAGDGSGKAKPQGPQVATFGGGCFWCTEAVCQRIPGVISVVSGYAGGSVPNPTYEAVSSGMTGHAEVVQVTFNPAILSYERLVEFFFRAHDPTTPNAQGPDVGTQYRSIILYHDEDQRRAALKVYEDLKARRVFHGKVVTQLVPYKGFYPAEAYHQNYYNNHPADPYSLIYIEPKFDVFRKMRKADAAKASSKAARPKAKAAGGESTPSRTPVTDDQTKAPGAEDK